jgi:hypothetical protein
MTITADKFWKAARAAAATALLAGGLAGCERTAAQKAEDAVEDAGHEIKQGAERTGENIERATDGK